MFLYYKLWSKSHRRVWNSVRIHEIVKGIKNKWSTEIFCCFNSVWPPLMNLMNLMNVNTSLKCFLKTFVCKPQEVNNIYINSEFFNFQPANILTRVVLFFFFYRFINKKKFYFNETYQMNLYVVIVKLKNNWKRVLKKYLTISKVVFCIFCMDMRINLWGRWDLGNFLFY